MNKRLTNYLESRLTKVPEDYKRLASTNSCLFCEDTHDAHPVYIYNGGVPDHNSGCHACSECNSEIVEVQQYMASEGLPFTDSQTVQESTTRRIERYVMKGEFDSDIHEFYEHDEDGVYHDACYFCHTIKPKTMRTITVPVDVTTLFSGGKVKVCEECSVAISKISDPNAFYVVRNFHEEVCAKCLDPYLITPQERSDRQNNNTQGAHMCPRCCFQTVSQSGAGQSLKYRYQRHSCDSDSCPEEVYVDRSLTRLAVKERHFRGKNLYCDRCNLIETPIVVVDLKNRMIARFFREQESIRVTVYHKSSLILNETFKDMGIEEATLQSLDKLASSHYPV